MRYKTDKSSAVKAKAIHEPEYLWHAHSYKDVLAALGTADEGLTSAEAQARLSNYGPNEFSAVPPPHWFYKIWSQLKSPLVIVLMLAGLATIFLGEYLDAIVITVALLVTILLALWQEGKASKAFAVLSKVQASKATIFRDGVRHELDARVVVPGDIVELQAGMQVPADMRLMHEKQLSTNEASLTGEWLPVEKCADVLPVGTPLADQVNMVFKGTAVQSGFGIGVVVATGDKTAVGAIAAELSTITDVETPLQANTRELSMWLLYIIGGLIIAVGIVGVWLGQPVNEMILLSIAMAVAAIPEGLPAAVTIVLAIGMESLLRRGGLVRNLLAAETLGATSYILTDKTGTLTEAKMTCTGVLTLDCENFDTKSWVNNEKCKDILATAYCATDTYIEEVEGKKILRGESTERAVAKAMRTLSGGDVYFSQRIDYIPFSSEARYSAGLAQTALGKRVCVSGSPELLLESSKQTLIDGDIVEITGGIRQDLLDKLQKYTSAGQRLLGIAYKYQYTDSLSESDDEILTELIFAGIIVLSDPLRPGMKDAISLIKAAGAKVVLVTGDNPDTALAIARAVGIASPHESALSGTDITNLTDDELREVLTHVHVFARVLPKQKLRLAQVLQQAGEIVAMTGDGVNDAPALQKANIGIALGSGTQVAKEASDLILTRDSFATMYAAIEEGRRISSNVRKIVAYLLTTSFSEIVLIGSAVLVGAAAPLLPAQILWANIIEEGLMSVAFAFEKGEKGAMKRRPHDLHEEGILSKDMLWFMAVSVTILSTILVSLYFFLMRSELSLEELRSAMFLAISIDSLFLAFAFRSLSTPIWRTPLFENRFFIGSFLVSLLLLFGALSIPFMREVLSYVPLPGSVAALVVTTSVAGLLVIEISKWVFFERRS